MHTLDCDQYCQSRHQNIIRLNVWEDAVPNSTRAIGYVAPGKLALLDSAETHERALAYSLGHGAIHWKNGVAYAHMGVGEKLGTKLSYHFSPAVVNPDLQDAMDRGFAYQPDREEELSPLVSYPLAALNWLVGDVLSTEEEGDVLPNGVTNSHSGLVSPKDPVVAELSDPESDDEGEEWVGTRAAEEGRYASRPLSETNVPEETTYEKVKNVAATTYKVASTAVVDTYNFAADIAYDGYKIASAAGKTVVGTVALTEGLVSHVYHHGQDEKAKETMAYGTSTLKSAATDMADFGRNIPHTIKSTYTLAKDAVVAAATTIKTATHAVVSATKAVWSWFAS